MRYNILICMAFILLNLDRLSSQVLNEDDKVLNLTKNSEFKKMKKTDSEWRRILSSAEYYILRENIFQLIRG